MDLACSRLIFLCTDGHSREDSMDMSGEWSGVASKPLIRRQLRDANRHVARSLVGTPNYIAPEVLLREGA